MTPDVVFVSASDTNDDGLVVRQPSWGYPTVNRPSEPNSNSTRDPTKNPAGGVVTDWTDDGNDASGGNRGGSDYL